MLICKVFPVLISACFLLNGCTHESGAADSDPSSVENLIANPGFENIDNSKSLQHGKESLVLGWTAYFYPADGGIAGVAAAEKEGEHSVFLEVPDKVDIPRTLSWQSASIPVTSGQKYSLQLRLRTEGLLVGKNWYKVRIFAVYENKNNQYINHQDLVSIGSEQNTWTSFSSSVKIPLRKDIENMKICLGMSSCHGKVFFDDVRLSLKKNDQKKMDLQVPSVIIFPQPKKLEASGQKILVKKISADWSSIPDGECEKFMKDLLGKFLVSKKLSGSDSSMPMKIEIDQDANGNRQWYKLCISENEIKLIATSNAGVLYGLQTLFQIVDNPAAVPALEIEDWPDFETRGIITGAFSVEALDILLPCKINLYWPCGGNFSCREWTRPMTESEKSHLRGVIEGAKLRQMNVLYSIRPGWGKTELCYSSPEHLKYITDKYKTYYELGLRNFSLAYDDLFNIGRDILSFPEDKKAFRDMGEAHYHIANELYKFLKSLDKNNTLYVIPMYYYDPTNYSESEKKYLMSLGKLPDDVVFINCGTLSKNGIDNFEKLTGRKPFFWSNFMAQFESVKPMPEILSPLDFKCAANITKELKGFSFVAVPKHRMMRELFSDFMWNADHFNAEQSFDLSMRKQFGADQALLGQYVKFKDSIKSYPLAGAHKEEIPLLTEGTINNLLSWKTRLKSLPPEQKKVIDNEIDMMVKTYRVILADLKEREYPLKIYPTANGFAGLKTKLDTFMLPYLKRDGVNSGKPEAGTLVETAYDKDYLYIRFICHEPYMDKVRAVQKDHDSMVYTDDCVEIFLMPDGNSYYHLAINKLGTVYDEKGADKSWDSGAEVKAHSEKENWIVECRIPWTSVVKIPPKSGDSWRVNFARARYGGKEEFSSAFFIMRSFHEPERFWPMLFSSSK